jgi:hypothetical protein
MLAAIDWDTIGQLLWVAPLGGFGVATSFALLILGVARADEARRERAGVAAAAYSTLALVAGLAFAAVVVFGVQVIATK